jgi:hypothetical protein
MRCHQIIAVRFEPFQEGIGDLGAYGVHTVIRIIGMAATITKPSG